MKIARILVVVASAALALPLLSLAQQAAATAGLKRTVLQQADLSAPGREVITALVEIAPGAASGRHTHPGEEISYVIEGTVQLSITGKPVRELKAGEAFIVPAGTIHDARNPGNKPAKLLVNYVVEKGKALVTPAP